MRKIMKRGFSLFLVAVLLAGLVPCAFADEAKTSEEVEASEAATEAAEETTAPPETEVPSESTEPPEATETTESETEVTEPEADPVEDAPEDAVEDDRLAAYASTVTNVLLFDKASQLHHGPEKPGVCDLQPQRKRCRKNSLYQKSGLALCTVQQCSL